MSQIYAAKQAVRVVVTVVAFVTVLLVGDEGFGGGTDAGAEVE